MVVVGPPAPDEADAGDDTIVAHLEQALEAGELPRRGAQRRGSLKVKRSRVYELGLALERKERDAP